MLATLENGLLTLKATTGVTACARLKWPAVLKSAEAELREVGVGSVACLAGGFVVWAGDLGALPEDIGATNCGPAVAAWQGETDPAAKAKLHEEMKPACRVGGEQP